MQISRKEDGKSIVFQIKGDVIGPAIVQLCKVIERERESEYELVLLDLSAVQELDSGAIGGLIYSDTILRKRKNRLAVTAASESVMQLLEACSSQGLLDVQPNPALSEADKRDS
jgi:anti-anti-sigma factor